MNVVAIEPVKGSRTVLPWFSFKSSRRGAAIYGVATGLMVWLQGLAFAASYTTDLAREKFATAIASNPAVGILYGEVRRIETPAGYMVYRTLPFLGVIGGLWALAATTRLLRGQEEDGRLELLLTGRNTLTSGLWETLQGFAFSLLVAFVGCAILLVALGQSSKIDVSPSASIFFALAIFMPAIVFASVGALTSQLAATRRKAMVWGAVALAVLFALRSIGNVIKSLDWLKNFTPFGWTDKLHAVTGSAWIWLLPLFGLALLCILAAFYFAGQRDMGESIIPDNDTARPRYRLLGSTFSFGFRLTRTSLFGWLISTIAISGLITGLAKTAINAVGDSNSLSKALGNITGGNSALALAFIGFSGFFIALMLMIVAASGIGRIREDEAKGYLDNFLVNAVSRKKWLTERVLLLVCGITVICIIANTTSWIIARAQGFYISPFLFLGGGLNFMAPALLMLGIGTLIFSIKPRWASWSLYAWIVWSFLIEMIGSVVTLSSRIIDTSLLRQVSLIPAVPADWKLFSIVSSIGLVTFIIGLWLFDRRDLASE